MMSEKTKLSEIMKREISVYKAPAKSIETNIRLVGITIHGSRTHCTKSQISKISYFASF